MLNASLERACVRDQPHAEEGQHLSNIREPKPREVGLGSCRCGCVQHEKLLRRGEEELGCGDGAPPRLGGANPRPHTSYNVRKG